QAVHVPFTGGAPAVAAAAGGHIDAVVLTLPTVTPQINQGALRGLGLASDKRNSAVPDVPTYAEMAFPDFRSGSWVGFFVPGKTAQASGTKLNGEINELIKGAEAQERLRGGGFDPMIEPYDRTAAYFRDDVARWGKMTAAVGLSAQ